MVMTIEPGLYIPAGVERGPAGLAGTGIRIEDDVIVTEAGVEVLTEGLPAAADAVESMVSG
jgi:Xaa-Pro aminopeptidase